MFCIHICTGHCSGESKRRTLPLWLREELEKLERKKAKQMEKEVMEGVHGDGDGRPKWAEELERERERERGGEREVERGRWEEWQGKWEREEEEKGMREKPRSYRQPSSSSHVSKTVFMLQRWHLHEYTSVHVYSYTHTVGLL